MTAQDDAQKSYDDAVRRAEHLKAAWEELGSPVLETGSRGQAAMHPLLRAMNEAECVAARLRTDVLKRHRGPEPKAVVQAAIGKSPAAKLRSVE